MERQDNSTIIKFIDNELFKVILVYLLLIFGAVWQVLDMFTEITRPMAGPIIIGLSILAFWEIYRKFKLPKPNKDGIIDQPNLRNNFIIFSLVIIVISWLIELIGVQTKLIFGNYFYNSVLQPTLFNVPIAIGFAWFLALVTSHGLLQKVSRINLNGIPIVIKSVIVGFIMMFFDFLMEPAAMRLYYWSWEFNIVPLQNYLAWFTIGTAFAFLGFKLRVLKIVFPSLIYHIFLAMVLYFLILQFA